MGRDHRDMNRSADKKTAFVTGASYGVGAATALALARDGFDVAVSATRAENLDATTARLEATGVRVVPLVLDLGSESSIERAMAAFGHLDLLVNNAGSNLRKLAVDVTWAPDDADACDRVGGARHPRKRDSARPARHALTFARGADRRSELHAGHARTDSAWSVGDRRRSGRRRVLPRWSTRGVDHRANARAGRRDHRCVNSQPGSDSFQRRPEYLGFFRRAVRRSRWPR
jgi:hypothetical protein